MLHLVVWALAAVGAAIGTAVVVSMWNDIRDELAGWLRRNGLQRSAVMSALVRLDRSVSGIRAALMIRSRSLGEQQVVLTRSYALADIDDAVVRAELQRRGTATMNVMTLLDEG